MFKLIQIHSRDLAIVLLLASCASVTSGQSDGSQGEDGGSTGSDASAIAAATATSPEAFPRAETVFPQLESILVAALSRSPTMIQEDLVRLAAQYQEAADRSVLYPRAGGYGYYYVQEEERREANTSSLGQRTYFDVNVNQPLFHWGALKAQASIGRLERALAERNFTEAYQSLANRIRDSYLQLVSLRVARRNRVLEMERVQAQLATIRARIADGQATAAAAHGLEYQLESLELAHDRAEYALRRTLRQFQKLTGRPEFALQDVPETIPELPKSGEDGAIALRTEFVTRRGFENRPVYLRATNSLAVDRKRLHITRTELRPKVNFVVGYSQNMDDRTVSNIERSYVLTTLYAGLRVTWSIWDSKSSQSRARAAQARIRRAEKSLETLEEDLIESVETAQKEVEFSARNLNIVERNYWINAASYDRTIAFEKEGRSSQDQVDSALFAMRSGEYGLCEARRGYLGAVAEFLTAIDADPLVEQLQREGRLPR